MIAKIYQLFFQELIRYVTKMTCDKAAAEDIVQETFLRAMEHAVILDDMDERQCRSWLYKTSRNIFIDKVRRESACPEAEEKTETQDDLSQIEVRQLYHTIDEIWGILAGPENKIFVDVNILQQAYGIIRIAFLCTVYLNF